MNKLYKLIPKVWLNGKELADCSIGRLYYREVPKHSEVIEYTDFNTVWNKSRLDCRKDTTLFRYKRIIIGRLGLFEELRVSEKDFVSYKVQYDVETYEDNEFSFYELAKLLSATDFAKWCKDNGLQICPLK